MAGRRAVHQQARRQHEQERQDERAPADQAGDPAGGPAVGAGDVGRGVGGERHRRRDHGEDAVVHDEHVRGHRRHPELDQRGRQQRGGEDVDADRRQADAEQEGEHGDQQQQQEDVVARERNELQRHAEGEARDAHDPDHEPGRRADQDDVERDPARLDDGLEDLADARAAAAIAEHQREQHQHAGATRWRPSRASGGTPRGRSARR